MFSSDLWLARTQILLDFSSSRREREKSFHLNSSAADSRLDAKKTKHASTFDFVTSFIVLSFFGGLSCVCVCVCVPAKPHAFLSLKVRNTFYVPSISTRSSIFATFLCPLARDICSEALPFNIVFFYQGFESFFYCLTWFFVQRKWVACAPR